MSKPPEAGERKKDRTEKTTNHPPRTGEFLNQEKSIPPPGESGLLVSLEGSPEVKGGKSPLKKKKGTKKTKSSKQKNRNKPPLWGGKQTTPGFHG